MSTDYIDEIFGPVGALSRRFEGYSPRPGQVAMARAVDLAIRERGHLLVEAPTGCHAAGQGVLMFDGRVKKVEDVQVGDLLMGPDSETRTVLGLARGEQEMVDVVPVKGKSWRVNLDHVLTLVRTGQQSVKSRCDSLAGCTVDVCVRDVLEWSRTQRHIHKLFRRPARFGASSKFVLSPYFLGLVLGDGALSQPKASLTISTADSEIKQEIEFVAVRFGLRVRHDLKYGYRLSGSIGNKHNPILAELRRLGLHPIACQDRFVPQMYKTASRKDRLEILAGLIDTDGSLDGCSCFDYISKSLTLANDVAFLARSLGLAAYVASSMKSCQGMFEPREYFRVCISGDTSIVPCRLPRKQAPKREQVKDVLRTGFDLIPTGTVEPYFGFTLDRDGRFLLDDFTVTHNTGKSLAYAVPAIWHVTHPQPKLVLPPPPMPDDVDLELQEEAEPTDGEPPRPRAIIVTANIALQEQLVRKDLPLLREVLPWKFTYSLLKGMGNFLCRDRLQDESRHVFDDDVQMDEEIRAWAEETETGDKSELSFEPPARLWSHFSTSTDECGGKDCEFFKQCFPKNMRKVASEADVIVTNYALFFLDILVKVKSLGNAFIIPPYNIVIMDEGHKAVDIARDFFGWRVTEGAIDWASSMLPTDEKIEMHKAQSMFFFSLREHRKSREYKARIKKPNVVSSDNIVQMLDRGVGVYMQMLSDVNDEDEKLLNKEQKKKRKLMKRKAVRLAHISDQIKEAMRLYAPPQPPWVKHPEMPVGDTSETRWYHSDTTLGGNNDVKNEAQILAANPQIKDIYFIEEERDRIVLSSMPVSVAEYLRETLFRVTDSVSVTSATLVASGSFGFIVNDLGICEPSKPAVRTLMAESPFNWREQALLVLPEGLPEPNAPNFVNVVVETLAQTIDHARGRTLGLFTSYKNMNAAYERLKKGPWRILKQNDMPRTKLIDEFRKDINSVLLGVESFWAGVDVQGESLSCVFIDRLPFATPDDPLLDALAERDKDGWFMKYSVPQAIIAFKQGFGRLIRTTTDKGVVVVCDRRLTTKSYGQMFLKSLPPVLQSSNLADVRRFLDGEPLQFVRGGGSGRSLFDSL